MSEHLKSRAAKRHYWKKVVSDWDRGHFKTQKEFCQQNGISYKSLSRWRRVFRQEQQPQSTMVFSTVHVRKEPHHSSGVRIALHDGIYIDLSAGFDTETLQRVLGVAL